MPNFLDKHFGRLGNRFFQSAYIYAQWREGKIPDIYLQNYEYFDKYKVELQAMFSEGIGYDSRVSIHVRRGKNPSNPDEPAYFENPFYVNLWETDYYQKAMAMFPDEQFLIFSDDIQWCMEQKFFKNQTFSFGTEMEDFKLMASCKSNIICNSTYGWWAAYLNPNPDKIVVAPKEWFTDKIERVKCPPEWKRI